MDSEQNLLFGVLALRLERISPEQLADVCVTWSTRRDRPRLADLIVERGWIDPAERAEMEASLGAAANEEPARPTVLPRAPSQQAPSLSEIEVPGVRGDRYTIQRFLGEGGAGRVFVALDHVLNREVALKEGKPDLARKSEARRRLLREVQITGQLEHPGIVPIYDLAREPEDDTPFYTMRLLRGQTLQHAIADYHNRKLEGTVGPLELPRLLHALISICNAIGYAHSRGVLHRDLKPENVLLGRFGEVVLLDWGLAKVMTDVRQGEEAQDFVDLTAEASPHETVDGIAVGTPAYMAPEQVDGEKARIDRRTDVYGLGAILFELLSGRAPHVGDDSAEVLTRIVSGPSPRARDVDPGAPAALEAVCAKAMEKLPEDRYDTASEVADELERYLADQPVTAFREDWVHRMRLWARRNPAWSRAAAAALLITISVTTTAAIWLGNMASNERAAREQGLAVAAKFAAGKIANEIDLRWHHLQEAAGDPQLRAHLREIESYDDIMQYPAQQELEQWLMESHRRNSGFLEATSWFLEDAAGYHLARSPPQRDILGVNFAYRDYFHGEGRDYPEDTRKRPIRDFHRSNVFRSKATGALIVAFTTPVWDVTDDSRRVIGVLGMTVELGAFGGLQTNLGDDQLAVLIETNEAVVDEQERSGLVLHHPGLADTTSDAGNQLFSVDPELVTQLKVLRNLEIERRARAGRPSGTGPDTIRVLPYSFAQDYRDPIGGRFEGEWLAAFEPVIVNEGSDLSGDTGWIVIVQERK